jgi:hypothetical protein
MDPNEKAVYLTFDDGPIPEVTPWVLDLLDKHNIKATFFMVGDNIRKHPDEFRMVVERGHRIGNHTFNHIRGFEYTAKNYLGNTEQAKIFMEMGFTGEKAIEWKIKYLTAFNEMEKMLSGENSVMKQLNIAVKIMSEDKAIASKCGVGLNKWKEVRKDHIAKIDDLNKKAQLLLNFK